MKKRLCALALSLVLAIALAAPAFAAGGTMYIYTPQDLKEFGERMPDEPDLSAVLMVDLDLSAVEICPLGMKTIILGPGMGVRREVGYRGTFDGNGHTISNPDAVLIANLAPGGVIKNLNIVNGYCISDKNCGLIENCSITAREISGTSYAWDSGTISCSVGEGFYTDDAGWMEGPGTIRNCRAFSRDALALPESNPQAHASIGGIVGTADKGVIENCWYDGSISVSGPILGCGVSVGGVAGKNVECTIINCGSSASITVNTREGAGEQMYVGGIVGSLSLLPDAKVINCCNVGDLHITAQDSTLAYSGTVGDIKVGTVENCWSSGTVTASGYSSTNGRTASVSYDAPEDLTNGNLVSKLNAYVSAHPEQGLRSWKQGAGGPEFGDGTETPAANTAYASTQEIEVDGKKVTFEAYALKDANGNDTNYIKLRDVANVLNGTAAQFQVGWNGSVAITTGQAYTPNGSEMSTPYSGNRTYKNASAATVVNGSPVELSAILLTDDGGNGYTYYKLRDLGTALGFRVDWTAERGIFIETN